MNETIQLAIDAMRIEVDKIPAMVAMRDDERRPMFIRKDYADRLELLAARIDGMTMIIDIMKEQVNGGESL